MATVRYKQDRLKEALENMERALTILRQCLPSTHPEIAASLSNIATHYFKNDQYSDAMTYYKECLSIQEASLPAHHPDIVRTTAFLEQTTRQTTRVVGQSDCTLSNLCGCDLSAGERIRRSRLLAWALFCLVVVTIVALPVFLYVLWKMYDSSKPLISYMPP